MQSLSIGGLDHSTQAGKALRVEVDGIEQRRTVGERDVAPHDRIAGGDSGEIAETARRKAEDVLARILLREFEVVRQALLRVFPTAVEPARV